MCIPGSYIRARLESGPLKEKGNNKSIKSQVEDEGKPREKQDDSGGRQESEGCRRCFYHAASKYGKAHRWTVSCISLEASVLNVGSY